MARPDKAAAVAELTESFRESSAAVLTEYRVDRQANLHFVIGKTSFTEEQLVENYAAALDEVLRAKPSAAKGRYLKKVAISTTMGPGILVDPNKTRNLASDDSAAAPASA